MSLHYRSIITVCLAGAALMALLIAPAFGQGDTRHTQRPTPTAVPEEPLLPRERLSPHEDADATASMTDTVTAALEAYREHTRDDRSQQQAIPFDLTLQFFPLVQHASATAPTPTPAPAPEPRADVSVTLRPNPSIYVQRGGILRHDIRVRNYGAGPAGQVEIMIPYDGAKIVPVNSAFEEEGDFVSELEDNHVTVVFGPLAAGEERSGAIFWSVDETLPDETVISIRGYTTWTDAQGTGSQATNWAPVLVGALNESSPYVFVAVTPEAAPQGTILNIYSDRFLPEEPIVAWLNTPDGVRAIEADYTSDSYGRIALALPSAELAPAGYEIVLYGTRSKLTGVQGFTITPA